MSCFKGRRPPFRRPRIEKRTRHDSNVRPQASHKRQCSGPLSRRGLPVLVRSNRTASAFHYEPVAQTDQSASLRSLRLHVRVVPGSLSLPGSSKGRTPVFGTGYGGSSPPPGVRVGVKTLAGVA